MRRFAITASFVLFFLLPLIFSAGTSNLTPALVSEVNFTLRQSGLVEATGGSMSSLEVNVSIPGNYPYQTASYDGRVVFDEYGNSIATIHEPSPPNPYRFDVISRGTTRERITTSLPTSYQIPQEYSIYLRPSNEIQSDDSEISRLAATVTANSTDDWDKIVKLTKFVNSYVTYDKSLVGQEKDARWVLENRRGVCVEFANLYAAMARSQGIPTRIITGYATSPDGSWQAHAWAESYVGEWVPVDPTWLEAGHLDGTHIQLSRFPNKVYEAQAYALTTPGGKLKLTWINSFGGTAGEMSITGLKQNNASPNIELKIGTNETQIGNGTIVYAILNGSDYRIIELALAPCKSAGMYPVELLDEQTQIVATRPGVQEIVVWRIRSDPALSKGYIWTCPLILNSPYFENKEVTLTLTPQNIGTVPFNAWLSRNSVLVGESQTIYYEVKTGAPGERIGIIADSGVFEFPATRGIHTFNFTPKKTGLNRVFVYSSKGGAQELTFTVSREPSLRIKALTTQGAVIQGKPFTVFLSIENSKPSVESALVTVSFNGENKTARASIEGIYTINFTFVPSSEGLSNLSAKISGESSSDDYFQTVEVKPQPSVQVSNINYAFVGTGTTVILNLTGSGKPLLLNVSIGGRKIPAQFGEVSIETTPGEKLLQLEWLDEAGNYYNSSIHLDVPATPPPATPTPSPSPTNAPVCGILHVLLAFLLVAVVHLSEKSA